MKLKTRFIKQKIHPNSTIGPPVVLVHRQTMTPEADIFGKNPTGYICGRTLQKSPEYLKIVASFKDLIDKGKVTTKRAAQDFLQSRSSCAP